MTGPPEGLLLVDKPSGPTSHDIVARLRRVLGLRRIGHAGTLDPMASGLLPVALGRATRLIRFLPSHPKVYVGTIRLGIRTDTDDVTGTVTARHDGALPDEVAIREAAAGLVGTIAQVPPAVSAKKIEGRRAYRLARSGRSVLPAAVEVDVVRFEIGRAGTGPGTWTFEAAVSPGTYVRALARDLGDRLGCGGALDSLRRTAIGPFSVASSVRFGPGSETGPDELASRIIRIDDLPLAPPSMGVADDSAARRFRSGIPLPATGEAPGFRAVRSPAGALLGVAEVVDGTARPRVVLAAD